MKYCSNCGKKLTEGADVCLNCGKKVTGESETVVNNNTESDSGSFGYAVLGFFFPLVGLILFLVWKSDKPLSAKKAGIGALVSTIISVVITIIAFIIGFAIAFNS